MIRAAAVVVTYHPSVDALTRLLQAVHSQAEATVIVDNTPAPGAALPDFIPHDESITVIRNGRNAGLGAAQNQGIRWAQARAFTHVFMLDQDSVPEDGCIARLHEAACGLAERGIAVAAVGPRVVDRRSGRAYSFKRFTFAGIRHSQCRADGHVIPTDFVIASGSLTTMEAFQTVGLMDEGLFIDRIDIDWCLRAASMGRALYGVCAAQLQHEPGEYSRRIWIGRWTEAAVHSPERNYYMVRNSVVLYRKVYAPLRWILNDIAWLCGVILISCAIAPSRMCRVSLVLKGIWDGVRGKQGPLERNHSAFAGENR
jgi:rhamnosyltransferase